MIEGLRQRATNDIADIIMAATTVVYSVARAPGRPPLEPDELRNHPWIVEQAGATSIQQRQGQQIDFRLRLFGQFVLDLVSLETLRRPAQRPTVSGHRRDAIRFQNRGKLLANLIR